MQYGKNFIIDNGHNFKCLCYQIVNRVFAKLQEIHWPKQRSAFWDFPFIGKPVQDLLANHEFASQVGFLVKVLLRTAPFEQPEDSNATVLRKTPHPKVPPVPVVVTLLSAYLFIYSSKVFTKLLHQTPSPSGQWDWKRFAVGSHGPGWTWSRFEGLGSTSCGGQHHKKKVKSVYR